MMSACISQHGEFGSHELDDAYICTLCGVLDEGAMVAELQQLRAELARAEDFKAKWRRQAETGAAMIDALTRERANPSTFGESAAGVPPTRPTIVCLCGSTRFSEAFQAANLRETLADRIVLSIGCNMRTDTEIFGHLAEEEQVRIKTQLDDLHKHKINLADEILVLNVGGYVGDSTWSEIAYAVAHGKRVRWLEHPSGALLAEFEAVKPR